MKAAPLAQKSRRPRHSAVLLAGCLAPGCVCPPDQGLVDPAWCEAPVAAGSSTEPSASPPPSVEDHFPVIEPCNPNPEPVPPGAGLNLGVASYPEGTCMRGAAMYKWQLTTVRPSAYRMGYALSSAEAGASREGHRAYASDRGAKWLSDNQWAWITPPGCDDPWQCLYASLVARDDALIEPIADKFRSRADTAKLSTGQVAELVLRFVQSLTYQSFKDASEPFGIRSPALVAAQRSGDCDSKALLALMILRDLDIDSVLISSTAHQHAMLGIAVTVPGKSFVFRGRKYAYAECASPNAPLGYISPKFLHPDDWKVLELPKTAR